jgi:hypothetical protein
VASGPTQPRIFDAQNTVDTQRLVAAQSRMYSDAKIVSAVRLAVVLGLAVAAGVVAINFPALRTTVGGWGGAGLLALSFAVGSLEKRLRIMAASTQEAFDTTIFQLDWNTVAADRPSPSRIAKAASRYDGGREANWYDDTKGTYRPFDVLACQSTNLGWGASMHRLWAYVLCGGGIIAAAVILTICRLTGLAWDEIFTAVFIPSLAPIRELFEQIRANLANAKAKEGVEKKISDLWAEGMAGRITPTDAQLRAIQDKILSFRQDNAFVPDWLDKIFYRRNEAAMRVSVEARVNEAKSHGLG